MLINCFKKIPDTKLRVQLLALQSQCTSKKVCVQEFVHREGNMCKDKAVVSDDHHDLDIRNMNGIVGGLHSNLYSEKNDIRSMEGDKADI